MIAERDICRRRNTISIRRGEANAGSGVDIARARAEVISDVAAEGDGRSERGQADVFFGLADEGKIRARGVDPVLHLGYTDYSASDLEKGKY